MFAAEGAQLPGRPAHSPRSALEARSGHGVKQRGTALAGIGGGSGRLYFVLPSCLPFFRGQELAATTASIRHTIGSGNGAADLFHLPASRPCRSDGREAEAFQNPAMAGTLSYAAWIGMAVFRHPSPGSTPNQAGLATPATGRPVRLPGARSRIGELTKAWIALASLRPSHPLHQRNPDPSEVGKHLSRAHGLGNGIMHDREEAARGAGCGR